MKYKEFKDWCNQRACDGCWGMQEAIVCMDIIKQVQSQPFWKRERKWKEINAEFSIENGIVIPINDRITQVYGR